MKLKGIIKIKGTIRAVSGIAVGSGSPALEINVQENEIIRTKNGVPYISGNSLKGKLRNMLAMPAGSVDVETDFNNHHHISELFGSPEEYSGTYTRLQISDAFAEVINDKGRKHYDGKSFKNLHTENPFTEIKSENTTDRYSKKSVPRKMLRTFSEVEFPFEMKYKISDDAKEESHLKHIRAAMKLLEDEYIGGNGSRGYGQIKFEKVTVTKHLITGFEYDKEGKALYEDFLNQKIEQ